MVTLITEKLRNQKLDDVQFEPIPQTVRRSWELSSAGWSVFSNCTDKKELSLCALTAKSNKINVESGDQGNKPVSLGLSTRQRHPSSEKNRGHCAVSSSKTISSTLFCESLTQFPLSSTPPAPPLKRHCRSLSIPGDCTSPNPPAPATTGTSKKWQPQASTIWKPVALRSHIRDQKLKSRNSPLGLHKHRHSSGPGGLGLTSNVPQRNSSPGSLSLGGHGSADSGRYGADPSPGLGMWSVASSDSFSTPPESPIPRPASASSGFYDSSQGSLNAPWLDNLHILSTSHGKTDIKVNFFKARSYSMEEPISNTIVPGHRTPTAGSMPVIPHTASSTPSSPRRHRVPRCRSQPCDLQDRKCGLKRRRDDDRPTLDLFKMKETAYERPGRGICSRPKNVQFLEQEPRSGRMLPSIFSEPPECFLGLNTIASSPLDNVLPALSTNTHLTAQISSPGGANSESANHPRRELKSTLKHCDTMIQGDVFPCLHLTSHMTTRNHVTEHNGDDDDDSDAESDDTSCNDDSARHCGKHDDDDEGIEQVFQLEMNNELDIEQIEKD